MIIFENDGEIEVRAIANFGVSVKETENPIGFFGTGLKYALAVLLRTGHEVVIQCGLQTLHVRARAETIRGKEFGLVYAGDVPLGFTTELGKTWEVWMAYRELHCNAKDERGAAFQSEAMPDAESGKTRVIVIGEPLNLAHATREDFLLLDEPAFKLGTMEVRNRPSRSFFFRGIKVFEFPRPALFTYNQTARMELTEDRTLKNGYEACYHSARAILAHADKTMLEHVLMAGEENIEHHFDYHGWGDTPGADFFSTVGKLQRHSVTKVNQTALRLWREQGRGFIDPRRVYATKIQSAVLEKAIAFCEKSGFMLRDEYPIIIVESLGDMGVLAMADRVGKQIFLTEQLFNQDGTKGVARALIEEYVHIRFGYADLSREMQNFLFAKMVSLAEQLTGEPL